MNATYNFGSVYIKEIEIYFLKHHPPPHVTTYSFERKCVLIFNMVYVKS